MVARGAFRGGFAVDFQREIRPKNIDKIKYRKVMRVVFLLRDLSMICSVLKNQTNLV